MIFNIFRASVRSNMASSWFKIAEVGDKLTQVGCKLTTSWPKLFPRRPKRSPDAPMQARSSFHSGFPVLKKVATHNGNPASSRQGAGGGPASGTLSWAEVLRNALSLNRTIESIDPEQPRDMGQRAMNGSITPWAQGPANLYI